MNPLYLVWSIVVLSAGAAIIGAAVWSLASRRQRPPRSLHPVDDEPWTTPRWRG